MKGKASKPETTGGDSRPFRLIVHIGAGKTGTSSIQNTLRVATLKLREIGTIYLGLMFETGAPKLYPWQSPRTIENFYQLDEDVARSQLRRLLRQTIRQARDDGMHCAIWSNETLFSRSSSALSVLKELEAEGTDVEIIAYVRRHDQWARSAYVQWALKHKTNSGPLRTFAEFIERRPPAFAFALTPWHEVFRNKLILRNADATSDTVGDFLETLGLSILGVEGTRNNQTPPTEELLLRAVFNSQFNSKVKTTAFTTAMGNGPLPFDVSLTDWLARYMPSENQLNELINTCAVDRRQVDKWLISGDQPAIDTVPMIAKPLDVDSDKVVLALTHVVMRLAHRVTELEKQLTLGHPPDPIVDKG